MERKPLFPDEYKKPQQTKKKQQKTTHILESVLPVGLNLAS